MHLEAAGNTYDAADPRHPQFGQETAYMRAWPTSDPLRTLHGTASKALLVPVEGRDGKEARHAMEAMRTQTTCNETGVLVPPLLMRNNTGGAEMSTPTHEVMRTLTTAGHQSLITQPGHHILMEYYGNGVMHPVSRSIPTIPTVDQFAMVTTMRGTSPEHLAASNAPVSDPFGTFSAGGQHHGITEWTVPDVNECEFRILEPREITAGMAFPHDYIMTGNKREQVKKAGNAVTRQRRAISLRLAQRHPGSANDARLRKRLLDAVRR
ncbi:hypothetical protein [Arthrobacter sp. NPDC092385]|uniref:hypothetical protein n=1 Tax=Arthrobacter sp. NPDC092385 TaxID=3363943 RepID=UPI003805222D